MINLFTISGNCGEKEGREEIIENIPLFISFLTMSVRSLESTSLLTEPPRAGVGAALALFLRSIIVSFVFVFGKLCFRSAQ